MKRCAGLLFQTGVHVPHGVTYNNAAKMKHWPAQAIPENFKFLEEQRFKGKAMPRDTGKIPRDFVLSVLYRHQPCEVSQLWEHCTADPQIVLDSKRHLRDVLQQARGEGYITFEQDEATHTWHCALTRERFEDVRGIVGAKAEVNEQHSGLRGVAATGTTEYSMRFQEMNDGAKREHVRRLAEEVKNTTRHLKKFQRTEVDYLPYTDLNGKVNFMWWYETTDVVGKLPEEGAAGADRIGE